ncbi:DTW domain-containing protein [Achromobacter sp. KS-M25]|nr:DTW domain-containing protein [Achromobacter aestuarii]
MLTAQCVCALVAPIDNRTPVRVLQDPRESTHALNTARWVALGLRHAEIVTRATFTPTDWTIAGRQSLLLYPAEADGATGPPVTSPLTLIVLDGTWKQAAGMLRRHPALLALPRFGLAPKDVSAYRLRKSPRTDGLSTVEAVAAALDLLDAPQRHAAMLRPFHAQVDAQIRTQLVAMGETAFRHNYPHIDIENMV